MSQNKSLRYSIRLVLFSLVFIICGITQIVAGITFLIVFKLKILWTASNIWIGVLNAISGSAWMKISTKKKLGLKIGICLGLTILNVTNWLLMELGEWREFLKENVLLIPEKGFTISLITAAYLSTMVPTVIAFVVALLACQYFSALLFIKHEKENEVKIIPDPFQYSPQKTSFTWVFNQSMHSSPGRQHYNLASIHTSELSEEHTNVPNVSVHPCPTTVNFERRPSEYDANVNNINEELLSDQRSIRSVSNREVATQRIRGQRHVATYNTATIHRRPLLSSLYTELSEEVTRINGNESMSIPEITTIPFSSNIRPSQNCALEASASRNALDYPATPMDADTLVHLTQMELLARQWRFQFQYKALKREVSIRLEREQKLSGHSNVIIPRAE